MKTNIYVYIGLLLLLQPATAKGCYYGSVIPNGSHLNLILARKNRIYY